jgi:hypothetical protein
MLHQLETRNLNRESMKEPVALGVLDVLGSELVGLDPLEGVGYLLMAKAVYGNSRVGIPEQLPEKFRLERPVPCLDPRLRNRVVGVYYPVPALWHDEDRALG